MKIKEYIKNNFGKMKPWLVDKEQGMVEWKILPYLEEIENGFFIEAGAHNGLFQSNTKILEDLGWTGILIEPSPNMYNQCKSNRKCLVENCALVPFNYLDEFVTGNFDDTPRASIHGPKKVKIKAKTLTSILLDNDIKHVDFFSLDVEGYEMEVLNGIDFNTIEFKFLLIEVNSDFYSLETLTEFLNNKGFEMITNISNFTPQNSPRWPGNHQDYLFKKI